MERYVLALDQGTTSSRAALFDSRQRLVALAQKEFTQFYPQEGWVEHDPTELYASQYAVMMECLAKSGVGAGALAAIGITNQRETTLLWERRSGRPVHPAIVWQCRRTAPMVDALSRRGLAPHIRKTTGLMPDAYFSATKIRWLLDHLPGAQEQAEKGEILFGTVDSWLVWKLTGGAVHATDYTNASRTMLFDIHRLDWDERMLRELSIPRAMLPAVLPSGSRFGTVNIEGRQIPIAGIAGDQQAALFGQCCYAPGEAKITYGTGCFMLMHTGEQPVESQNGLLTTLAATAGDTAQYALEGSVFSGGSVIQWLRDELRILDESRDAAYYAQKVPDHGGVYLVPAFTGLGAPHWDMYARGILVGLTRGVRREHIIRAAEESIAYQCTDLIRAMEQDSGIPFAEVRVDGGACRDDFLMQFQADIAGLRVVRPAVRETTALGAACLAGLTVGLWDSLDELRAFHQRETVFSPTMIPEEQTRLLHGWHRAVGRSRAWIEPE